MKTLDDKSLILTHELAKQIGCNESFLYMLLKEIERRKSQNTQTTCLSPA